MPSADFRSDEILTVPEVAKWLRVGQRKVYAMAHAGQLPCVRLGKFILFRRGAIKAWLRERENPSR